MSHKLSLRHVMCACKRIRIGSSLLLYCTRCTRSKRVTSWESPSPCHCSMQHSFFRKNALRCRTVGNNVFNFTGPRFEPQTSSSSDERVTARPTGWSAKQSHNDTVFACQSCSVQLMTSYAFYFFDINHEYTVIVYSRLTMSCFATARGLRKNILLPASCFETN